MYDVDILHQHHKSITLEGRKRKMSEERKVSGKVTMRKVTRARLGMRWGGGAQRKGRENEKETKREKRR